MHRITLRAPLTLSVLLAASLVMAPLPGLSQAALAQSFQSAQNNNAPKTRPILAVLPTRSTPYNNLLLSVLRRELPDYEPTLINVSLGEDTAAALAAIRAAKSAGTARLRLGERELSEIETRWLLQSEMMLVADWAYTPLTLSGPHAPSAADASWAFKLESDLNLKLDLHRLDTEQTEPLKSLTETITVGKEIPIPDVGNLQRLVQEVSGIEVDINNGLHQAVILDVVRKIPTFQQLMQQDPASYLEAESGQALAASRFAALSAGLKELGEEPSGTQTAEADGDQMVLQPDEEARVDTFYLFQETSKRGSRDVTETIGFGKVRGFEDDKPVVQVIAGLNKLTGKEAVVRNSKLGLNVALRAGTVPLWFEGPSQFQFGPQIDQFFRFAGMLELEYNIGQWFRVSELYLTLGGSVTAPVSQSPLDFGQPFATVPLPSAIAITGELGLLKRWFLGQLIIDAGASGGMLFGLLSNPQAPFETPTTMGFGGTARVGASWQFTPEFIAGLHLGFRYMPGGIWMSPTQGPIPPQSVPLLNGWGPLIMASASYTF